MVCTRFSSFNFTDDLVTNTIYYKDDLVTNQKYLNIISVLKRLSVFWLPIRWVKIF